MQKNILYGLIALLLVGGLIYFSSRDKSESGQSIKAAHYESSTPADGAVLAGVPINIVVNFNFDLGAGSTISVKNGNTEYATGETIIDPNKLVLRQAINPASPDGRYTVNYNACWADGSCDDGRFYFSIDRASAASYTDLTSQQEITINLAEIQFQPMNIRIKQGTKVAWINADTIEHFVNTDSHPAHTYYLAQNSLSLAKGETYTTTFNTPGIYPYHCSAHADTMIGNVLVES